MALFIERSTVGMCIQCSATHYLESQTAQLLTMSVLAEIS